MKDNRTKFQAFLVAIAVVALTVVLDWFTDSGEYYVEVRPNVLFLEDDGTVYPFVTLATESGADPPSYSWHVEEDGGIELWQLRRPSGESDFEATVSLGADGSFSVEVDSKIDFVVILGRDINSLRTEYVAGEYFFEYAADSN